MILRRDYGGQIAWGMSGWLLRLTAACLALALLAAIAADGVDAKTKTKTFSSGPINRAIPDAVAIGPIGTGTTFIEESIRIRKRGRVKDVDVGVRISHPDYRFLNFDLFKSDFSILVGEPLDTPTGVRWRDNGDPKAPDFGAGAPDCTGAFTVFDDSAPLSIDQGTPPFAGTFRPLSPLRALKRAQLKGKWRLEIGDVAVGDAGVLKCWQLKIRYKPEERKK